MSITIGDVPIYESLALEVGVAAVEGRSWIAVHPLDMIAIRSATVDERLGLAMAWIVEQAHRKLDAAMPKPESWSLTGLGLIPSESPEEPV